MTLFDNLKAQWAATSHDPVRARESLTAIADQIPRIAERPDTPLYRRRWRAGVDALAETTRILQTASRNDALNIMKAATETPGEPAEIRSDWRFDPAPRRWIVADWLPAGRVALLAGEGGRGKSRLALQLAYAVAAGNAEWWLQDRVRTALDDPREVLFATWEDDAVEIRRRLADNPSLGSRVGPDEISASVGSMLDKRLQRRLTAADMSRSGPLWGPLDRGHVSTVGGLTAGGEWIRAYCAAHSVGLLIIDPLAAAYGSNENDRGLVRAFMSSWDAWARAHDCAVLLVAHPPKSAAAYAGSTDWHAAARAVWTLGTADEVTTLECVKSSYGPRPPKLRLSYWPWWRADDWSDAATATTESWTAPPE